MSFGYLDVLDKLLGAGVSELSEEFLELQLGFAAAVQTPDGGFRGRDSGPDLYYTDFGARALALLNADAGLLERTGEYVAGSKPTSVVDCFGLLNCARIVGLRGIDVAVDKDQVLRKLQEQQLAAGGFSRPGGKSVSAYNTFLAALCFEMMELGFPSPAGAVHDVLALRCSDGGFSEMGGQSAGQTNATAAAVAFLTMHDALAEEDARSAARFLAQMQSADGGLLAQPSAPEGDLLSTFTGCLTLFGLNALDQIDVAAVARFVGGLADAGGGFRACFSDDQPDIEYTYYGLGTLALLRAYVLARQSAIR